MNKPVNDTFFDSFSSTDWSYYAAHISVDSEEETIKMRDMVEYLAMFSNPEGVDQVRTNRAQREIEDEFDIEPLKDTSKIVSATDDQFAKFIAADGSKAPRFRAR